MALDGRSRKTIIIMVKFKVKKRKGFYSHLLTLKALVFSGVDGIYPMTSIVAGALHWYPTFFTELCGVTFSLPAVPSSRRS